MKKHPAPESPRAHDLLLEIGVEELPARFVPDALESLAAAAAKRLEAAGLPFAAVRTLGTPRRLALLVEGLAEKGKDIVQEALGPGVSQAKDADGNWTPAAQGFARSQGVPLEKLEVRATDRGDRLCAVKRAEGAAAAKALPELLPELIRKLPFPKNMVWEDGRLSFARPIRWIVALYGDKPVKFELAGVKSGRKTWGLRFHSLKPFDVPSPARYAGLLQDKCVIADPIERRKLIEKQILHVIHSVHGAVRLDQDAALLDEVVHLVEHPVAILAKFDPRYLALPPEILVTSMKKHQKFFPVYDKGGKLSAHFVGIRNGMSENQAGVREGYERVLAARLSDAEFFFQQDRKARLEEKAPLLKGVLFQKELGSVWDKTERVVRLAEALSRRLALSEPARAHAGRVALLAKADLVSAVVGEFPELQGVMGRIYAETDGEPAAVAQGVEQHYWPLTAEGDLPSGEAAAVVSLADKLDTLAGDFLVGLVPSGSQDPYGLRRAAVGVLRILRERRWRLSLAEAVDAALSAFPAPREKAELTAAAADEPVRPKAEDARLKARRTLLDFFRQRWAALMEARGYRFDEIEAVAALHFDDVVDAERRLEALHQVRRHPDFTPLAVAFKRAANILAQARKKDWFVFHETKAFPVAADKLAEPAEKDLFAAYQAAERETAPHFQASDYPRALAELVKIKAPIDEFFSKVMVMVPDQELSANRLILLKNIEALFRRVADLSKLQDVPTAPAAKA